MLILSSFALEVAPFGGRPSSSPSLRMIRYIFFHFRLLREFFLAVQRKQLLVFFAAEVKYFFICQQQQHISIYNDGRHLHTPGMEIAATNTPLFEPFTFLSEWCEKKVVGTTTIILFRIQSARARGSND